MAAASSGGRRGIGSQQGPPPPPSSPAPPHLVAEVLGHGVEGAAEVVGVWQREGRGGGDGGRGLPVRASGQRRRRHDAVRRQIQRERAVRCDEDVGQGDEPRVLRRLPHVQAAAGAGQAALQGEGGAWGRCLAHRLDDESHVAAGAMGGETRRGVCGGGGGVAEYPELASSPLHPRVSRRRLLPPAPPPSPEASGRHECHVGAGVAAACRGEDPCARAHSKVPPARLRELGEVRRDPERPRRVEVAAPRLVGLRGGERQNVA